jgi:DNA-binding NtrC family response regulator
LIATSKIDLTQKVQDALFRDDLFFRLNVMELAIPSLRERREDIMPLATAFIKEYTQGHARFAATVTPCLENYLWPGNIRELRNAMERATLMAHGGLILPKHLPTKVQAAATADESGEANQTRKMADVERETILQSLRDNRNNRSVTARVLGISRRALTYKLQRYREDGYLNED